MSETGQLLIAEVRRVAGAHPDKVYDRVSCAYMHDDGPGCIIGHALYNLGYLTPENMAKGVEGVTCSRVFQLLEIGLDNDETKWLEWVQAAQDGRVRSDEEPPLSIGVAPSPGEAQYMTLRRSWGAAVKYADDLRAREAATGMPWYVS